MQLGGVGRLIILSGVNIYSPLPYLPSCGLTTASSLTIFLLPHSIPRIMTKALNGTILVFSYIFNEPTLIIYERQTHYSASKLC